MSQFEERWDECKQAVEKYLENYLAERSENIVQGASDYAEAIHYAVFAGGKRFRPALTLMTGEALGLDDKDLIPYAAAVELIHCFSLVHDDLPCMDDDDFRRGKPTTHMKFDEATALLAGDGMIMEAVQLIIQAYSHSPELSLNLINCLMEASGSYGMIAGQVVDIKAQKTKIDIAELEQVHLHKTGALIRCAADGACLISKANAQVRESIREYAELLGLCFQIKDDLLEVEDNKVEMGSFPGLIGVIASNKMLTDNSDQALELIEGLEGNFENLKEIVRFNSHRSK
ncbi:MAG: geranyl transferase [Bdellovibrionaceae bacterium]|nr:geranyl transferase [Pseudobdellovibrionaceae bacterium]|tara:strand:+ start:74006 stop:74866 length:861 start_codon:yes stop_codon:yes gene_type:complete